MVEKRSHGLEDQIIKARSENDLLFVKLATIVVNGCVDAIQEQGKLIVEDRSSSTRARSLAVDLVRPIIDTNIFLQALESRDKLNSEVIRYIKAGAIKYLSGSDQKHAEMKIYEELGGGVYYIGITKLACWPCNTVLEISNSHKDELEVKYSGTHGGTYPGWEAPQWILENQVIKQEFLTKLQENLGRFYKGKELYPYEEYFIPAPPMLAEFNSIEHARTQLTIIEQEKSFLLDKVGNIDVEVGKEESIIDALTQDIEERQNKLTETNEKIQRLESNVKQAQGNVESAQSERYGINNIVIELESICATTDSAQIKWDACRKLLNAKDKNLFGKLRPELQKLGQDSDKLDKVKNTMALMETEVSQRLKAAEDDYNSIQLELQECKESLENLNNEKEQLNFRKNAPEEFKITLCKNKDDVNEEVVLIKEKYQLLAYCIECYNELYSINNNDTELSGESTNIAEIS